MTNSEKSFNTVVEAYVPTTPIAARVARHLDEAPPTADALCLVADALEVPVERFLIGGRS